MCPWRPRQTKYGQLPNILYIIRKHEPLGTEFKTICCPLTGIMTFMEIQHGKYRMKNMRLQKDARATAFFLIRCVDNCHQNGKLLKDTVKGDAWFGSVKCAINIGRRGQAGLIQVKSNHGLFPKKYIKYTLTHTPGGTHIVLKGAHH